MESENLLCGLAASRIRAQPRAGIRVQSVTRVRVQLESRVTGHPGIRVKAQASVYNLG